MTEHAENRKPQTVFPRSHEDADTQDVGGTNSGKHYERARVMACQQIKERQNLHGISKAPAHTITANIQEKTEARACLEQGQEKALHCISLQAWPAFQSTASSLLCHSGPLAGTKEEEGNNPPTTCSLLHLVPIFWKRALNSKSPNTQANHLLTYPFRNTSAFGWIFKS